MKKTQNIKTEFLVVGGLFIFLTAAALTSLVFQTKSVDTSKVSKLSVTSNPTNPPNPPIDPTADWKEYNGETGYTSDGSTNFSIMYPGNWVREKNILYPYGKKGVGGIITTITLGASGRGGPWPPVERSFPAGKAYYYWSVSDLFVTAMATFTNNNKAYIFYVDNLPKEKESQLKPIFDQILSTFLFLDDPSKP